MSNSIWTVQDRVTVQNAIRELVAGKRMVKVRLNDGPVQRDYEFTNVDLPQLRSMLAEINRDLSSGTRFFGVTAG
jgi:hypothetical protein